MHARAKPLFGHTTYQVRCPCQTHLLRRSTFRNRAFGTVSEATGDTACAKEVGWSLRSFECIEPKMGAKANTWNAMGWFLLVIRAILVIAVIVVVATAMVGGRATRLHKCNCSEVQRSGCQSQI